MLAQVDETVVEPGGGARRRLEARVELVDDIGVGDGVCETRRFRRVDGGEGDIHETGLADAGDGQGALERSDRSHHIERNGAGLAVLLDGFRWLRARLGRRILEKDGADAREERGAAARR